MYDDFNSIEVNSMQKKEFLEKILEKLADSWSLWKAILVLLKNDELDEETVNNLVDVMEESLAKVEDLQAKKKIMKGIEAMKKMRQIEMDEKIKDNSRLEDLDNLIDSI